MKTLQTAVVLLLIGGAACKVGGSDPGESDLAALQASISDLVGRAPAAHVSACKTIAFGSKPCGGPWTYLVYSSEYTDEAELHQLIDTYNRLQDRINRDTGLASDCALAIEPEVELVNGFCSPSTN